ncbi:DUF3347 domain-containing protein [Flavobacterium sp.]|jgi:copper chaperone CopZ|uniref:DUF3347 domain-containing protein n=1 Tax=Flavobacterium sp. TaxID=239 RepID=UPI002A81D898|nr:DUF3347 domain-containing protein [Flavobacterium sp.]
MKNSIIKVMVAMVVLLTSTVNAQIRNAKTETFKVYGNCGMCESKIEKSGSVKKIAKVDWNQETSMATITYDAKKTTSDEILKRIALAGYDSDKFLAPDDVYSNLHGCCQYDRVAKTEVISTIEAEEEIMENHSNHQDHSEMNVAIEKDNMQLKSVFDNYFLLKDALVNTDGTVASKVAKELVVNIESVKMNALEMDVHMVWMKVMKELKNDATVISNTKDTKIQRASFDSLSIAIYKLIKVSKTETPIYYQRCPMANGGKGATWLSKESAVKNPYYGSMMMSCGKVIETIK